MPFFKVNKVDGQTITVNMGKAHGLHTDALLAVYSGDKVILRGSDGLICQAKVTAVNDFDCIAKFPESCTKQLEGYKSLKVVPATPTFGTNQLRVVIDEASGPKKNDSTFESFKKAIENSLNNDSQLQVASSRPGSRDAIVGDLWIRSCKYKEFAANNSNTRGRTAPGDDELVYYVTDRNGIPLFNFCVPAQDSDKAAEQIVDLLMKKLQQDVVRGIDNAVSNLASSIGIDFIRVTGTEVVDGKTVPIEKVVPADQTGLPNLKIGEKFRIQMTNKGEKNLYVTILALGTSGNIHVIYPPKGAHDVIGSAVSVKSPVITVGEPLGTETLKLMITTEPTDFSYLRQTGVSRQRGIESSGQLDKSLSSLIKRSIGLSGSLRDCDITEYPDAGQWTTIRRDFVISPKSNADTISTKQAK